MAAVRTSLTDAEFAQLFRDFTFTAYRLETLQRYTVSYEKNEFDRFLAGGPRGEFPGITEWIEGPVRAATAVAKRMHRVHIVEEPLSDYVRFECAWAYEHTTLAGEEVRIIPVAEGTWPDLPRDDYWLFDSSLLVSMRYDDDGVYEAAELVDDPARIVEANHWRDQAIYQSIPYRTFANRYDSRFRPVKAN